MLKLTIRSEKPLKQGFDMYTSLYEGDERLTHEWSMGSNLYLWFQRIQNLKLPTHHHHCYKSSDFYEACNKQNSNV